MGVIISTSSIWKHTTSRDKGVFVFFHSYLATSATNWVQIIHRFVILCICWDTLSERTSLWQLPIVGGLPLCEPLWLSIQTGPLPKSIQEYNSTVTPHTTKPILFNNQKPWKQISPNRYVDFLNWQKSVNFFDAHNIGPNFKKLFSREFDLTKCPCLATIELVPVFTTLTNLNVS